MPKRKCRCFLCQADVSEFEDDYALRVVRTEPQRGQTGYDCGHRLTVAAWHLCEECSDQAVTMLEEAMENG